MHTSQIYILMVIIAFALIAVLLFMLNKNKKETVISPLAGISFNLVLAGLFFGEHRIISYILVGVGIILTAVDIVKKSKNK